MRYFLVLMFICVVGGHAVAGQYKRNPPLSESEARATITSSERYIKFKCIGKKRWDMDLSKCESSGAAIIFSALRVADFQKAAKYANMYPFSTVLDDYTACGNYHWNMSDKEGQTLNGYFTYYVLAKRINNQINKDYFYRAYFCTAFRDDISGLTQPQADWPVQLDDYVEWARSELSRKEADELERFNSQITGPYRQTINGKKYEGSKGQAFRLEVAKNAASAAKKMKFSNPYTRFMDGNVEYQRYMLTIYEQTK